MITSRKKRALAIGTPGVLVGLFVARGLDFSEISGAEILIGISILLLSVGPAIHWARNDATDSPLFPVMCLAMFPYYGYPILTSKSAYVAFPESSRIVAGLTVAAFLIVTIFSYFQGKSLSDNPIQSMPSNIRQFFLKQIAHHTATNLFLTFLFVWVATEIARNFGLMASLGTNVNVVYSIGGAAGKISIYYLFRQIGLNALSGRVQSVIWPVFITGLLVSIASGFLVTAGLILVVAALAYIQGKGRIPWVAVLVVLGIFSFLNLGKGTMRELYWARNAAGVNLTTSNILDIYETWLSASWRVLVGEGDQRRGGSLLERANLIQMQTLVINRTPDELPYLMGATYLQTPDQAIPRILWPDKPTGNVSNNTLSIYYGVQRDSETRSTSISFGLLAEAWANFGWWGILGLGVLFGAAMRLLSRLCYRLPDTALLSLVSVIPLGWAVAIELAFSQWFVSLCQALVAGVLILYLFASTTRSRVSLIPIVDQNRIQSEIPRVPD